MAQKTNFIALDMGAESGRVMLGALSGTVLSLSEIHRFESAPVRTPDGLHTDVLHIWAELKRGMTKAVKSADGSIAGVGVDTWGVDFALLDKKGLLMSNPYHYRDGLTDGILSKAFKRVPQKEIFSQTGLQFMAINTLYQLYALKLRKSLQLSGAHRLLMTPDLFTYWLSGKQVNEFSIGTTSQCMDPRTGRWAKSLVRRFGLRAGLFGKVVRPGAVVGSLLPQVAQEIGAKPGIKVITGCHDTTFAVAAVPAANKDFAYISCGTWSLIGAEIEKPCMTDATLAAGFTNEGGAFNTIRFLKNLTGLWILQECRREWEKEGKSFDYTQLTRLASEAAPLRSFINVSHASFAKPGSMPEKIREFCRTTGQPVPGTEGAVVRCALESLALTYRKTLAQLEKLLGRRLDPIHVVGGGAHNKLLCQLAADATGRRVTAVRPRLQRSATCLYRQLPWGTSNRWKPGVTLLRVRSTRRASCLPAGKAGRKRMGVLSSCSSGSVQESFSSHDTIAGILRRPIYALILGIALFAGRTQAVDNYSQWPNSNVISVNTSASGAGVAGTVTRFPVLVRLNPGNFAGFGATLAGGADIRFEKLNGTHLPYQIERWVTHAGNNDTADIWVKLDTIFGNNSSQQIKVLWGNNTAVDSSWPAGVFETSNGFAGVWHMNEASGNIHDITSNAIVGTDVGGTVSSPGEIGLCRSFDTLKSNTINLGSSAAICDLADSITVSAWFKASQPNDTVVSVLRNDGNFTALQFHSAADWFTTYWDTLPNVTHAVWKGKFDNGQWHYVTSKYKTGSGCRVFFDGLLAAGDSTNTGKLRAPANPMFYVGSSGNLEYYNGLLDEIRIEKAYRSPDWIALCYRNQQNNQTLIALLPPS